MCMRKTRKSINHNSELRSKNSKEVWSRPGHREKMGRLARKRNEKERESFPVIECQACQKQFKTFPSRASTQKYCSNTCKVKAMTGRPNLKNKGKTPSSRAGSGISGTYKTWKFRSLFELSFIIRIIENDSKTYEYEPLRLLLSNGKHYIPDFVCHEDKTMYEIKYQKALSFPNIVEKMNLAREKIEEMGYALETVTETDMKIVTNDEVVDLVCKGLVEIAPRKRSGCRRNSLMAKLENARMN